MNLIEKYLIENSFSNLKSSIYMQLTNIISPLNNVSDEDQMMKMLTTIENDVKTLKKYLKKRV